MSVASYIEDIAAVADYAIIVHPRDNVAVVKTKTSPNLDITLPDGRLNSIKAEISPGHRFATRAIPAGEFVLQYGQPIGTSRGINEGDPISHANMSNEVPVVRDLPENLSTPPPDYFPMDERATFMGFKRPDGRIGTRN